MAYKKCSCQIIPLSIGYFICFHLLFFTWQAIGTLRSCERNLSQYIATGWSRAAQLCVIISFAAVLVWGITLGQTIQLLKLTEANKLAEVNDKPNYILKFSNPKTLNIIGLFDQGITREVKKMLSNNSDIDTIMLNSEGGNIYEARGLAKLITENEFATHVNEKCYSACTTAYIAGVNRTAARNAKFGFHQYKLESKKLFHTSLSTKDEQSKDLEFFLNRNVDSDFLKKAFSTPFDKMWFPSHHELLKSGLIHKVI